MVLGFVKYGAPRVGASVEKHLSSGRYGLQGYGRPPNSRVVSGPRVGPQTADLGSSYHLPISSAIDLNSLSTAFPSVLNPTTGPRVNSKLLQKPISSGDLFG